MTSWKWEKVFAVSRKPRSSSYRNAPSAGPMDRAGAAQHHHHDCLDRGLQVEGAARLDDAALEEIEAAGDRRQERGDAVDHRLVARRRHAEHGGGVLVLADGHEAEPELRILDGVAQRSSEAAITATMSR